MALFPEELLDDLDTENIVTTKGNDGFYNEIPDIDGAPSKVICVYEQGGVPHNYNPAPQIAIRFRVRHKTGYEEARAKMAEIYNLYHGVTNKNLTSYRIISAVAQGLPESLGRDSQNRHIVDLLMNFRVTLSDQSGSGSGGYKDPGVEPNIG